MKLVIELDITEDQKRVLLQSYKTLGASPSSVYARDESSLGTLISDILAASKKSFTLGAKIRRLRLERYMNQTALGIKANISKSYVSQIECNNRSPSIPTLQLIAVALGVDVRDLFGE